MHSVLRALPLIDCCRHCTKRVSLEVLAVAAVGWTVLEVAEVLMIPAAVELQAARISLGMVAVQKTVVQEALGEHERGWMAVEVQKLVEEEALKGA